MKNVFINFFRSLPLGPRLMVLIYAVAFPIGYAGHATHTFDFYPWLGLCPASVWKGQVWRLLSYGLLPARVADWLIGTFWLATLASILGRNWTSLAFWGYCLLGAVGGAAPIVLLRPGADIIVAGNFAIIFALLVAWDRYYKNERLLLLAVGELSVRQAAVLIAVINLLIAYFSCGGWLLALSMVCGGVVGWIYLAVSQKRVMSLGSQVEESKRISRLEL